MKIPEVVRKRIIFYAEQGYSQRTIASKVECSQSAVCRLISKYLNTGNVLDLSRSGRPEKTTVRERKNVCLVSKRNPFMSSFEIKNEVSTMKDISNRTIRRILNDGHLFSRIAAKKPLLSMANKAKRLRFANKYKSFSITQWKNMIFSDECQIKKNCWIRKLVRRPIGKRFQNRYITKTVKYAPFSILVWGAIKGDGTRVIVKCPKTLNSENYANILEQGLPSIYNSENIFMQDGARCHTSRYTINYLETKNILLLSDWPPQSPDLNVIENLWTILKRNVGRHYSANKDALWMNIMDEWNAIPNETISTLYTSIPNRLSCVRKARGYQTKY